jgi:hypothetical protein
MVPLTPDGIGFIAFQGTIMGLRASYSGSCICGYNKGALGHTLKQLFGFLIDTGVRFSAIPFSHPASHPGPKIK